MKEPLTTTHPDLAIEWNLQKNGDLTANEVTASSSEKVWWHCRKESTHEWKTAILSTRVVNAKLTIVCCPNSVVEGWRQAILDSFSDSIVGTKTFKPHWGTVMNDVGFGGAGDISGYRYLGISPSGVNSLPPSSPLLLGVIPICMSWVCQLLQ